MLPESTELVKWWVPARLHHTGSRTEPHGRRTLSIPHGAAHAEPFQLSGEYLEVDPPWRLVYTFRWEEPTPDDRETVVDLALGSTGEATRRGPVPCGFIAAASVLCVADRCPLPAYVRWERLRMLPSLSRNQAAFPQSAVATPFSVFSPGKS